MPFSSYTILRPEGPISTLSAPILVVSSPTPRVDEVICKVAREKLAGHRQKPPGRATGHRPPGRATGQSHRAEPPGRATRHTETKFLRPGSFNMALGNNSHLRHLRHLRQRKGDGTAHCYKETEAEGQGASRAALVSALLCPVVGERKGMV